MYTIHTKMFVDHVLGVYAYVSSSPLFHQLTSLKKNCEYFFNIASLFWHGRTSMLRNWYDRHNGLKVHSLQKQIYIWILM